MDKGGLHFLLGVCVSCSFSWLLWQEVKAQGADWLPVKYVRIEGAFQYIAKEEIKQVLQGQLNHGLYNVDIAEVKRSVLQLPWAYKVLVKRVWPDTIDLHIEEHTPVVRWGVDGLMNERGEVFTPANRKAFDYLPLIMGVPGMELKLLNLFGSLSRILQTQGRVLRVLSVDERRAWQLTLANGLQLVLGRNEPQPKLERLLRTWSLVGSEQLAKVAVIDLRYPNGYALQWKAEAGLINWEKVAEMKNIQRIK